MLLQILKLKEMQREKLGLTIRSHTIQIEQAK